MDGTPTGWRDAVRWEIDDYYPYDQVDREGLQPKRFPVSDIRMRAGIERAVPREPTEEMLRVAEERNPPFGPPEHLTEEYGKRWRKRVRKAAAEQWQAMYDAAIRALEGKT